MNLKQNILIFSVYQSDKELSVNLAAHNNLMDYLKRNSYPVSEVQGSYKGIPEKSILVVDFEHRSIVEDFVKAYNQESYLESHNDRSSNLIFSDGTKQAIGKLVSVPRDEALQNDSYSYNDQGYFLCK